MVVLLLTSVTFNWTVLPLPANNTVAPAFNPVLSVMILITPPDGIAVPESVTNDSDTALLAEMVMVFAPGVISIPVPAVITAVPN